MRQYEVWRGDEYLGIYWEDELWLFEGDSYIQAIDISV